MNERYLLLQILQEGPGRKTTLMLDTLQKKKVVFKQVSQEAPQIWHRQIQTEAKVLQLLHSVSMPSLLEDQTGQTEPFLIEEYLEGVRLESWLKTKPSKKQKMKIFLDVIALIRQVHQAGYLYLDLQPSNILIHQDRARLVDFNACLPVGSLRPLLGSPLSLPPESRTGQKMDERADQIGLGRLYLRLFGPSWKAWVCLARNPDQRFSSLNALEKSCQNCGRKKSGILLAALGCAAAAVTMFRPWDSLFPEQARAASSRVYFSSAAEFAQALADGTLSAQNLEDPLLYSQAARTALDEHHTALAGYLLVHAPADQSFESMFYTVLLAMMNGSDLPADQLDEVLTALWGQADWMDRLSLLLKSLSLREILLSEDQIDEILEKLEEKDTLSSELCSDLMAYLLLFQTRTGSHVPTDPWMNRQAAAHCPDLYRLYLAGE